MVKLGSRSAVAALLAITAGYAVVPPPHAAAEVPGSDGAWVLTLNPAFARLPDNWLSSEFSTQPNVRKQVVYNNTPFTPNVRAGADNLDEALHNTPGKKIVLGHSEGAEVIDFWLRRYGPNSDIDKNTVRFVLTGDPENRMGGCLQPNTGYDDPTKVECPNFIYPSEGDFPGEMRGPGFPADTPYTVKVITRQYDFFADTPRAWVKPASPDPANPSQLAHDNREAANSVGGKGELKAVHLDYSALSERDLDHKNSYYTYPDSPNATYVLGSPATYYLPLVTKKFESQAQKAADDTALRPQVESVYGRPTPAPAAPTS